jgi:hypothetical protein
MDKTVTIVKDIKVLKIEQAKGYELGALWITYKERGKRKEQGCMVYVDMLKGNKHLDEGVYTKVEITSEYVEGILYAEYLTNIC